MKKEKILDETFDESEDEIEEKVTPEVSAYEEYLDKYGLTPSKNGDYVNKEEFFQHMKSYIEKRDEKFKEFKVVFDEAVKEAKRKHQKTPKLTDEYWDKMWMDMKPQVDDFIALAIMKIATHLSYRPNFNGYTYRSEFIGDAIENCLRYIDNFDPNKTNNPFAYFTQVSWYSFVRRITLEKNQSEIKGKLMMRNLTEDFMSLEGDEEGINIDETIRNTHAFVELAYQRSLKEEEEARLKAEAKEKKKQEKLERSSLSDFLDSK